MSQINKGWRNPAHANGHIVLIARRLKVDAEGFIVEDLTTEEAAKVARMPQWRAVERDGAEIQGLRLKELEEREAVLAREIENTTALLNDQKRRRADIAERILVIKSEFGPKAEETPIDLDKLDFNELRTLAAKNRIRVDPGERSRDKLLAALRPIVAPENTTPSAPVAPVKEKADGVAD